MASDRTVQKNALVNFDASTLTASYQLIWSGGAEAAKAFKIWSSSASLILFSRDGVNDDDFMPPNSAWMFDCQSNSENDSSDRIWQLRAGEPLWAKTSSATDRLLIASYY